MTRLAIVAGMVLALAVRPVSAAPQEPEEETEDVQALVALLAQQAKRVDLRAAPLPESPDLLPALWERIKARAVEDPRVAADPIPETPDLLPALWEQIKANARRATVTKMNDRARPTH